MKIASDARGSQLAESAMVLGLLSLSMLVLVQLGLAQFVRSTVADAAAAGARSASLLGGDAEQANVRTRALVAQTLGENYAVDVTVGNATVAGYPVIEVRASGRIPVLGLIGAGEFEVIGHAPLA